MFLSNPYSFPGGDAWEPFFGLQRTVPTQILCFRFFTAPFISSSTGIKPTRPYAMCAFWFRLPLFDLGVQRKLLVFIGRAHHSVSLVTRLIVGIVKRRSSPACAFQPVPTASCVPVSLPCSAAEAFALFSGGGILHAGAQRI